MPKITDHQKVMIEPYHSEGKSNREIARLLNIDEGSVRYILRKKEIHGSMDIRPKSGRPKKTTPR